MNEYIRLLKLMVRGAYDLQALRMQMGLRLCANFRSKLKDDSAGDAADAAEEVEDGELSKEAKKVIDELKESHRRLTDGIARNRTLPAQKGFHGDELISTYAELVLVDQYISIEKQEAQQFRQMQGLLDPIPIYQSFLKDQRGIGPAMAAVLVTSFDVDRAHHVTQFWALAGLDVAPDGWARSRRAEHLVDREYTDKNGEIKIRKGTTYDPWLRSKLLGALATSFMRQSSPWREQYDNYKHRIISDPSRIKLTVTEWKKRHKASDDLRHLWPPGRIHRASLRYMIKEFLAEFWATWRRLEGLPVTERYAVEKLGMRPHGQAAE
jgi:hypothetical protein